jgi:putative tryptophan/tyrosine transport system substrate-binding protein
MRRRDFIGLLGGAAAWPMGVSAQQDRVRRVVVLEGGNSAEPDSQVDKAAFEEGLQSLGWTLGRNIVLEYRWAAGDANAALALAKDLMRTSPDLVVTVGLAPARALQGETHTLPIIFARVSDPIEKGLITNLARPGGNVTGFSNFELSMGGKWLETLKEIAPRVTRVAMIGNPDTSAFDGFFRSLVAASGVLKIEPLEKPVRNLTEMEIAITETARQPDTGIIVPPDGFMITNRNAVIVRANDLQIPVIYPFRFFTNAGGLASYGINTTEQFRGVASYVDRILKGEKPGDLPVQAPAKFELVINLKTAKAIGLTVPPGMLVRADEVIE